MALIYGVIYKKLLLKLLLSKLCRKRVDLISKVIVLCDRVFFRWLPSQGEHCSLICVVPHGTKGWIIDGTAREMLRFWKGPARIVYRVKQIPLADSYFVAEHKLLWRAIVYSPWILRTNLFVWYTHPLGQDIEGEDLSFWLNRATKVVAMNSQFRDELIGQGVAPDKVTYVVGGADPSLFQSHQRMPHGVVGLSMGFYQRKDPDRVLSVVQAMPHRSFLLIGRNWERYARFDDLLACSNFEYVETSYENYPDLYRRMTVFLSPGRLEGGPIPLLETMMANVVPVASDTGFARDVIEHGVNGYLFPVDAPAEEVCALIDEAFENTADIRATAVNYSWQQFTRAIQDLTQGNSAHVEAP